MQTWYIAQLLFLPFFLIESYVYNSSCRKFYSLLKGLRNHAFLHSKKYIYRRYVHMVNQFFYTQVFSFLAWIVKLIVVANCFISVPLLICVYNPCYFSYVSFGLIPNFMISQQTFHILFILHNYNFEIQLICLCILEILTIFVHLALFIAILIYLFRRRRMFNNINKAVSQPLMESYRKSLLTTPLFKTHQIL